VKQYEQRGEYSDRSRPAYVLRVIDSPAPKYTYDWWVGADSIFMACEFIYNQGDTSNDRLSHLADAARFLRYRRRNWVERGKTQVDLAYESAVANLISAALNKFDDYYFVGRSR
jgi:hypothetical protein